MNIPQVAEQLKLIIGRTNFLAKDFDFQKGNYGTVFRSFIPNIDGAPLYSIDTPFSGYTIWNFDPYDAGLYHEALRQSLDRKLPVETGPPEGRILCSPISNTTTDGIAMIECKCFLDECDVPPIDTWFYIDDNYRTDNTYGNLYCWIPSKFEEMTQRGIDAEFMDTYFWLDKHDQGLNTAIFRALNTD